MVGVPRASQNILCSERSAIQKQTTLEEAVHLELDYCRKDDWRQKSEIAAQRRPSKNGQASYISLDY